MPKARTFSLFFSRGTLPASRWRGTRTEACDMLHRWRTAGDVTCYRNAQGAVLTSPDTWPVQEHLLLVRDRQPAGAEVVVVTRARRAAHPVYIQRLGNGQRETVDEFDTRKEARAMLAEYRMSDPTAHHYLSSRPCAGWRA